MTGPPDDPSDRPTRMSEFSVDGSQQQLLEQESDRPAEDATADGAPRPWYRNRVLLALWALMVALLFMLIIYGIVELSRGGGSSVPAPHTSSTTPTRSSTTSPATTPSTSTDTPRPESPEQTPEEAPQSPASGSPAPAEPPHHHHHLHLPHGF